MDEQAKKILLNIARKSIEATIKQEPIPLIYSDHQDVQGNYGVFVTLKVKNMLRGCIGCFTSYIPLYRTVSDMAVSSAIEDPRFESNRITPSELDRLRIELSILSPLKKIYNPLDFELGKHGIYIQKGIHIGCFLPQVAREMGWTKEEFLSYCCSMKADLSPDAWRHQDLEIFIFTAEIIEEL